MKKLLIVGIDLGKNTGISILDFKGNLIHLSTLKYVNFNELIKYICNFGKPLLISSDIVYSRKIKKIAASFGAKVFFPDRPLTKKEKSKLTSDFYYEDIHQRDALAASLRAFKSYRKIIGKLMNEFGKDYEKALELFFKTNKNIKEIKCLINEEKEN